uniref:Uncharacterized protein n=1 Tax=Rhizophora mucronata TaxID=61149 RepID=A0A2P2QH09_RHIMU
MVGWICLVPIVRMILTQPDANPYNSNTM